MQKGQQITAYLKSQMEEFDRQKYSKVELKPVLGSRPLPFPAGANYNEQ